jgi:hypothetical protein
MPVNVLPAPAIFLPQSEVSGEIMELQTFALLLTPSLVRLAPASQIPAPGKHDFHGQSLLLPSGVVERSKKESQGTWILGLASQPPRPSTLTPLQGSNEFLPCSRGVRRGGYWGLYLVGERLVVGQSPPLMKRFLKWAAITVGTLILLLILVLGAFLGWLRWSGEREWKRAEAELRAKGEKLTFAELVPPMPPDSENFYADPLWKDYSDLVRGKNAHGIDVWLTRLDSDQLSISRWRSVPLTPEEKNHLSKLIPGETAIKTRREAFSLLKTKLNNEKDPQKQQEIAALLLEVLAPADPVLSRIAKLSERPQAQFPIRYDLGPAAPLPQISAILSLSSNLEEKAVSELISGKPREASADTLTLLRLASVIKNEPLLISYLVRISSAVMSLRPINKGLHDHAWTEADLQHLQELLKNLHLQEDLLLALKGERCFFNQVDPSVIDLQFCGEDPFNLSAGSNPLDKLKATLFQFYVRSISAKDKAYQNLWIQRNIESLNAQIGKGWNTASFPISDKEVDDLRSHLIKRRIYMLNAISLPSISRSYQKAAECQTQVDQTLIACALERYRLAHGAYPASIDTLVPEYLAKLPNSPITGKPMNYSLKPDGTFLLWSTGWNLKSLGGKPGEFKGDGDIVWGMPVPMQDRPKASSTHN